MKNKINKLDTIFLKYIKETEYKLFKEQGMDYPFSDLEILEIKNTYK